MSPPIFSTLLHLRADQIFNPTSMCAYWARFFDRASRTRREQTIRPKISEIDVDLTELEISEV
jgi:hypothetical protein